MSISFATNDAAEQSHPRWTDLFAPSLLEDASPLAGALRFHQAGDHDLLQARLEQAPRDANFALDFVKRHAVTPEQREAVCDALIFKTNVLWVQLDALHHAYVEGHVPPGAFVPDAG